jgi:hypothetical protein
MVTGAYTVENTLGTIQRKKYPILLGLVLFAIAIYTVVTFQWLLGLVMIVITATFTVAFWYLDTKRLETEEQNEWVIIASGVIIAAVATAVSPWLVWAVALVVLFLVLHVLVRIEKRLSLLEYQSTRRILRRRTRGGAGPRHRA